MSNKDFSFARDIERRNRIKKYKRIAVAGLAASGAWGLAAAVLTMKVPEAPVHPGGHADES